jgi:hypothetical protein
MHALLTAYFKTGNTAYVQCLDEHIRDWVLSVSYPGEHHYDPPWGTGLDVSFRSKVWPQVFYGLQHAHAFTPSTRILLLSSLPDHAEYLRKWHAKEGNWITMEMSGLASIAACWPEFKNSEEGLKYSMRVMTSETSTQVYPDGVQKELTSHYHWVALANFSQFAQTIRQARMQVPQPYSAALEQMWNYLAYAMRPDGTGPLNNDSDRDTNRERVLNAVEPTKRPDWTWIATNGQEGEKPEGEPSVVFPWAGQVIMRSGWDKDAHWAFFDAGPLGMAHHHNDKLHLSVAAYGRDLLVDGGRYTYKAGAFRTYFLSSSSHNVLLVDGQGQNFYARTVDSPLKKESYTVEPLFDYARASFTEGFGEVVGKVVHTRAVLYIRGKFWVVVDRIDTDQPRRIQALWHYHPDCTVAAEEGSVTSTDHDKGNLRIIPVSGLPWEIEIVKGKSKPDIQGWYSERYNKKKPNAAVVYSSKIDKSTSFAWVLMPARGRVPDAKARIISQDDRGMRIRVEVPGEQAVEMTVPVKEGDPDVSL